MGIWDFNFGWNETVRTLVLGVAAGCLLFDGLADVSAPQPVKAVRLALAVGVASVAAFRRRG